MATNVPASGTSAPARASRYDDDASSGYGWVIFAGTMLAIVGTLNLIYGIAAVDDSRFYVRDVTYVITDLNTWGWFLIIVGAVQFLGAFAIWAQASIGRWIGVISASVNAILQMLVLPGQPFLALCLLGIDVLVIYALLAHGKRLEA